eukprot:symbB.v1.2.013204.t1/scaffold929.1/size151260/7
MGQKPSAVIAELEPPVFDDDLWMANCCKVNSMSRFAEFCLYQPDCRRFCDKGLECKYLRKRTSRGQAEAAEHLNSFCHVANGVLQAAAAADMHQRKHTEVVNLPADEQPPVLLPFVPRCWLIPKDSKKMLTMALSDFSGFPDALKGAKVVIFVHGFRCNGLRVMRGAWVLRELTRPLSGHVAVMAFTWPSHRHRKSYSKARTDAAEAAVHFASLLLLLSKLGCTVHVVAHSLGSRVALDALAQLKLCEADAQIQYLALLGAAVPRDVMQPDGEFPRNRLLARSVDVFYTRKDSILSSFFRLGEGLHAFFQAEHRENHEALGLLGPFDDTDEIGAFDLKEEVSSHSAEQYLLAPTFAKRLALQLCCKQSELAGIQKKLTLVLTDELMAEISDDSGGESD